jgi:hypothetical protein
MHSPFARRALAASIVALSVTGLMTACGGSSKSSGASTTASAGAYDSQLVFDKTKYTTITVTLDGVSTPVRWYREVCYVGKPMTLAPVQSAGRWTTRAAATRT